MITSIQNRRVASAARLKKRAMREKDRLFLVEGAQAVEQALARPGVVREVFYTGGLEGKLRRVLEAGATTGVPARAVSPEVMSFLTSTVTPQGVVAVAPFVDVPLSEVGDEGLVAVLVDVHDPANAGGVLRSAAAAGAEAVVFAGSTVDLYNQKAVRASAGSLFRLPVVRDAHPLDAVEGLRARGYTILAVTADGGQVLHRTAFTGAVAVVFGNEVVGAPQDLVAAADGTISIPVARGDASVSLAAAATLVLFEPARRRADSEGDLALVIAGSAHDIRSPLTAVRGFASTLLSRWDRLTDEQRRAMLDAVVHDAARMEVIVAHLVDAARLASGAPGLAPVPTDLLEAAREVQAEVERWGTAAVEVSGDPARALVDRARLRIMLLSLVEAAQWWGEEGPVRMEVASAPVPSLKVSRSETQLDSEKARALFLPRSPGSGGGSKVGLYVARRLAEAQGGTLEAQSDQGIAFTLTLPPGGST